MLEPSRVERAIEIIRKGRANRVYFFDKLADPAWVGPLKERGFFSSPPDPVERDGGIAYPGWPEGDYLARVAEHAPDDVAAVLFDVPHTENLAVRAGLLEVAARLPHAYAVKYAKREAAWLEAQASVTLTYPEAVASLVKHLTAVGAAHDGGLALLRELLAVRPADGAARWQRITTKMDAWSYGNVCDETFPSVLAAVGIPAIRVAADLLEAAVEIESRADKPVDHSDIWRPAVESHSQNTGGDVRDNLVSVIRDLAVEWVDDDEERFVAVVADLAGRGWTIFHRISLYLLASKIDVAPQLAIAASLKPNHFYDQAQFHEYMGLAATALPRMNADQRERWFVLLDDGPRWPSADPAERARQDISEEDYQRYREIWRRDRLAGLGDALPSDRRNELDRLCERYGRPEHPTFRSYMRSWTGPTAPLSEAELKAKSAADVVAFLREWQPSGEEMSPSPEGLGRALQARVASDPAPFAEMADRMADLDPTYIGAILRAFEDATKADRVADAQWGGIVSLAEITARAPALDLSETPEQREAGDRDPDWTWARRSAASVLETGMSRKVLPLALADRVWAVLDVLSHDPEPSEEYEEQYGDDNMDPLSLSINTTRGEAMHGVVQYAVWRKAEDNGNALAMRDLPVVAANLESHLDPAREPSQAVRAVFGSRLHQLYWIDPDWTARHIEHILPDDRRLRLAAWETYLVWGRPNKLLYPLLATQYDRAIQDLPALPDSTSRAGRDPGHALVEHLGLFYAWGVIDLSDDGPMHRLASKASSGELAHLVDYFGRSLRDDAPSDAVAARLIDFWEQLRTWVRHRPKNEQHEVFAPFGWWYGSGALDAEWADTQLLALLEFEVHPDPDFEVGERLKARATADICTTLHLLRAWLPLLAGGWQLRAVRDDLRFVLQTALKSTDSNVVEDATDLVHDLGSKGLVELRELLDAKPS